MSRSRPWQFKHVFQLSTILILMYFLGRGKFVYRSHWLFHAILCYCRNIVIRKFISTNEEFSNFFDNLVTFITELYARKWQYNLDKI